MPDLEKLKKLTQHLRDLSFENGRLIIGSRDQFGNSITDDAFRQLPYIVHQSRDQAAFAQLASRLNSYIERFGDRLDEESAGELEPLMADIQNTVSGSYYFHGPERLKRDLQKDIKTRDANLRTMPRSMVSSSMADSSMAMGAAVMVSAQINIKRTLLSIAAENTIAQIQNEIASMPKAIKEEVIKDDSGINFSPDEIVSEKNEPLKEDDILFNAKDILNAYQDEFANEPDFDPNEIAEPEEKSEESKIDFDPNEIAEPEEKTEESKIDFDPNEIAEPEEKKIPPVPKKIELGEVENDILSKSYPNIRPDMNLNDSSEPENSREENGNPQNQPADPNAAQKWWAGLQSVLDQAGCELDLSAPEDSSRLNIFGITKHGPDNYDFTCTFALDPEQRNIDYKTITRNDVISRQKNSQVTDEMILRMYEAAKNGLLIVLTPADAQQEHKPRQVGVGPDGMPFVGNDIDHMTREEADAIGVLDEPVPPENPGEDVRQKAASGDNNAKTQLRLYENRLNQYTQFRALWDKAMTLKNSDPLLYQKSYNLGVIMQQFFGGFWDEELSLKRVDFADLQTKMHKDYVYSKLSPEELTVQLYLDKNADALGNLRSEVQQRIDLSVTPLPDPLNPAAMELTARLIVIHEEMNRAKNALKNGTAGEFKALSEEEINVRVGSLRESDAFIQGTGLLSIQDLYLITTKPSIRELSAFADKMENRIRKNTGLVNDQAVVRPLLDEVNLKPSPEEAFWKDLEDTLNAAGYEMDLSAPEDLARLVITDIVSQPNGRKDVSVHYATDPQRRPVDQENITKEEILSRQKPGVPDAETLKHIKEAAAEGRLYVEPHYTMNVQTRVRPVLIGRNGKAQLGTDVDELTGDELKASRMTEAPVAPRGVSFGTKFLAFFGNRNAKRKIEEYNRGMAHYTERSNLWNEIQALDPALVKRTHNYIHAAQGHFYAAGDAGEARFLYGTKLTALHRAAEMKKMDFADMKSAEEAEKDLEQITDFCTVFLNQYNARSLPREEKINDINAYNLAGMIVARKKMIEAENRILLKESGNEIIKTDDERIDDLYGDIESYYKSDEFQTIRKEMTNSLMAQLVDRIAASPYTGVANLDLIAGGFMPKKLKASDVIQQNAVKAPDKKVSREIERAIKEDLTKCKQRIAKGLMTLESGLDKNSLDMSLPISDQNRELLSKLLVIKAEISQDQNYLDQGVQKMPNFKNDKELASEAKKLMESENFIKVSQNITNKDLSSILNAKGGGLGNVINAMNKVYASALNKAEGPSVQVPHDDILVEDVPIVPESKNSDAIVIDPMNFH